MLTTGVHPLIEGGHLKAHEALGERNRRDSPPPPGLSRGRRWARLPQVIGKTCSRVYEGHPQNFTFEFGAGALCVDCLWRLISAGRLVRTPLDHGQQFGLPAPVDAFAEARSLLDGRRIETVRLREETADLTLRFEGGIVLEVLSNSSGYEPWNFNAPGIRLIGTGGGGMIDA